MDNQGGRVAVGHPVDIATGAMFHTWTDVTLPGSIPLQVTRFYNTALLGAARGDEALGPGWRMGYSRSLRQTLDGFALTDDQGAEIALDDFAGDFDRTGRLVVPSAGIELRRLPEERILLLRYSLSVYPFQTVFERIGAGPHYALVSLGKNGRARLDFRYRNNRLWEVRNTRSGHQLQLNYLSNGRLSEVLQEGPVDQRLVRYEYDGQQRLARVHASNQLVASFEYDAAGRMTTEATRTGALYTFRYDAHGRCVYTSGTERFQERSLVFHSERQQTEVTDSHGHTAVYHYNTSGQVLEIQTPLGVKAAYEYDEHGRLAVFHGPAKARTAYHYDSLGHMCRLELPQGKVLEFAQDDEHRLVTTRDWNGLRVDYEYDAAGNVLGTTDEQGGRWRCDYNEFGEPLRLTNPLGGSAQWGWDAQGRNTSHIDAMGSLWSFQYDAQGRLVEGVDPLGLTYRLQLNKSGQPSRAEFPEQAPWKIHWGQDGWLDSLTAPDGSTTRIRLNPCGNLLEATDADGHSTAFVWDTEPGRLLEVRDPDGRIYRQTFDADGNLIQRTFSDGRVQTLEYDTSGRCIATVDPLGRRTRFTYDDFGLLVHRQAEDGSETKLEYDANGYLSKVITAHSELILERDALGRITAEVQNGLRVQRRFDALGRRVSVSTEMGGEVHYTWDNAGRCTGLRRGEVTLRFERDEVGRVHTRHLGEIGALEFTHDVMDRVVAQRYRTASQLRRESTSETGAPRLWQERSHGPTGLTRSLLDSTRGSSRFIHTETGRLKAVVREQGPSSAYEHDAVGNRRWAMRFETHDELLRWFEQEQQERERGTPRSPDVIGAEMGGGHFSRSSYGEGSRLSQVHSDDGSAAYQYDAAGQLVRKTLFHRADETTEHWSYEWDAEGQLIGLVRPDGSRWTYRYDGLGRRISKQGPGVDVRYVWDGHQLLHELRGDQVHTWVHEPGSHRVALWEQAGALYFVLPDAIGTPWALLSGDGEVVWTNDFDTWGQSQAAPSGFAARFVGQWADDESGLHYNFFRYYDPTTGQYLSPDPLGLRGGLNDYRYVANPLDWVDPFGLTDGCGSDTIIVYRAHVLESDPDKITGGMLRRLMEGGMDSTTAHQHWQAHRDAVMNLMAALRNGTLDERGFRQLRNALQDAQATGMKSPFISTTFDRAGAESSVAAHLARGTPAELLAIQGPREGGVDFNATFDQIPQGRSPGRVAKNDAGMQEFGIPDLFVPRTGTSASGFHVIPVPDP
ncbi:RHS repeat-associated core domain-containing protein [Myxococcus stipitatus]|uniref:RHS repeat-associated core domain-containing protein n=1 Tax=Myxococcus stipitatus TaxID=83455 RepID=UPI0030D2A121